jgi:hypothetical protein
MFMCNSQLTHLSFADDGNAGHRYYSGRLVRLVAQHFAAGMPKLTEGYVAIEFHQKN